MTHEIWGTMAFVIGSNSIVPVMCVSPDEMKEHLVYGNSRSTYQQKQAAFAAQAQRFRDERTTAQVCDQVVYPSIRLKEDYLPPAMASVNSGAAKPAKDAKPTLGAVPNPTAAPAPLSVAADNGGSTAGQAPSVADLARQKKQAVAHSADIKFNSLVEVAGDSCAWVTSKNVFSPLDVAASATTREGRVLQGGGNNAVAAVLEISLLFDNANHHVAWVHRSQTIDNRLTLAASPDEADDPPAEDPVAEPNANDPDMDAPDSDNPVPDVAINRPESAHHPFMSFHFQEEARARLLPSTSAMEWLAALRRFEQSPEPESGAVPGAPRRRTSVSGPLAQATKPTAVKKTTRVVVDSDTLLATPVGFTRYEKALCRDVWFCATASVALPGQVNVWDDTPLRSVYLARKEDLTISVAVGPALDRKYPGLTEDEELKKHAQYCLSNYVWMAVKPGIGTNFASATLDGYPGMITDFSATQRDLADMHGVLGLILTPWGKVVPVSCASDHAPTAELESLCEQVITSVSLRR